MEHHDHYWNHIDQNFKDLIYSCPQRMIEPLFIGQGWTKSVGSDCYGGYVVSKKVVGRKIVWGLVSAHTEMRGHWTNGTEDCALPDNATDPAKVKADQFIVQSGFWKNKRTGEKLGPKFYFCDENGKKFNGNKCMYSWNGCMSYRDPSF